MIPRDQFEPLFAQLTSAWDAHQALLRTEAPLAQLAESSTRLYDARYAMADWHRRHNRQEN